MNNPLARYGVTKDDIEAWLGRIVAQGDRWEYLRKPEKYWTEDDKEKLKRLCARLEGIKGKDWTETRELRCAALEKAFHRTVDRCELTG